MKILVVCCAALCAWSVAVAAPVEKIKNERVVAREVSLKAGELEILNNGRPFVVVFLSDGKLEARVDWKPMTLTAKRGDVIYRETKTATLQAVDAPVRFVCIEFLGDGDDFVWGTKGFAPDYKLLVESRHARVYDIHIPAGGSEPQHTHRDRVVVCLSGAKLRHVFPDGRQEDSSIATDDCLWRLGSTHVGNNLGTTPLWVIAIEPK